MARQSVSVHATRALSIKTVSQTKKKSCPKHFQETESESEAFHVTESGSEALPDARTRAIQHVVVPRTLINWWGSLGALLMEKLGNAQVPDGPPSEPQDRGETLGESKSKRSGKRTRVR